MLDLRPVVREAGSAGVAQPARPEGAAFMARKHINDFRRAWERVGLDYNMKIGAVSDQSC